MELNNIHLQPGKKVYFASDFHLGAPNHERSLVREKKILRWINTIEKDAQALFLMGDIFDFWFEYKHTVPKGAIRLQGKLASLSDQGLPIYIFVGNHDMWMRDYFPKEFGIPVFMDPYTLKVNNHQFLIGHGDGLGPGDTRFKILKKIFRNPVGQWLFRKVHPDLGIGLANFWSKGSRAKNTKKDDVFLGEDEWLWAYCREIEQKKHHDFYIFGHRHLPLDLKVGTNSRYVNLGDWLSYYTFGEYDGTNLTLKTFKNDVHEEYTS